MRRKMPHLLLYFTLIAVLLISGCSKSKPASSENIAFTFNQDQSLEKPLAKLKYATSNQKDKKYIYLILLDKDKGEAQKYEIANNGTAEITVGKNKDFMISLPADKPGQYEWSLQKELDESLMKLKGKTWSKVTSVILFKSGEQVYRQTLRFQTLRTGKQTLQLKYSSSKSGNTETFNITLNATVQ